MYQRYILATALSTFNLILHSRFRNIDSVVTVAQQKALQTKVCGVWHIYRPKGMDLPVTLG